MDHPKVEKAKKKKTKDFLEGSEIEISLCRDLLLVICSQSKHCLGGIM